MKQEGRGERQTERAERVNGEFKKTKGKEQGRREMLRGGQTVGGMCLSSRGY